MGNKTKYIAGCDPYTKDGVITEPLIERLPFPELVDEFLQYYPKFDDWKAAQERREMAEEMQKCIDDPYYFFTTYCTVNGEKAGMRYTREEFESLFCRNNG